MVMSGELRVNLKFGFPRSLYFHSLSVELIWSDWLSFLEQFQQGI